MPFSSSKYFYSWLRLSNLVDLSFEHLSFSNKRKTTILFPSPLTFLQWPIECRKTKSNVVTPLAITDDRDNPVNQSKFKARRIELTGRRGKMTASEAWLLLLLLSDWMKKWRECFNQSRHIAMECHFSTLEWKPLQRRRKLQGKNIVLYSGFPD